MKSIHFFFLFSFLNVSFCFSQKTEGHFITIYFENPPEEGSFVFSDEFGEYNFFEYTDSIKIESREPLFYCELSQNQIFILNSGDKIKLKLINGFFVPTNVDKKKEAELRFFESFRKAIESNIPANEGWIFQRALITDNYIKDPELRTKTFFDRYARNIKFLNDYKIKNELSEEFLKTWQSYFRAKTMEGYTFLGNQISKFPEAFVHYLISQKDSLLKEHNIYLKQYHFLSNNYLSLIKYQRFKEKQLSFHQTIDLIDINFTGQTKEFLKFRQIVAGLSKDFQMGFDENEIIAYLPNFYNDSKNDNYDNFIRGLLKTKNQTVSSGSIEILDLDNQSFDLNNITKKSLLTYVDVWASWCGPCIKEMSFSRNLKNEFNSDEIQFVYVSIDENSFKWKKASQRLGLENSFIDSNQNLSILFKIKSIPRYILLDKNGKVINENALRPSDPKIKTFLISELKKTRATK